MLHHLLWFLVGAWIGSSFTLIMLALTRVNDGPKPYGDETAPYDLAMDIPPELLRSKSPKRAA